MKGCYEWKQDHTEESRVVDHAFPKAGRKHRQVRKSICHGLVALDHNEGLHATSDQWLKFASYMFFGINRTPNASFKSVKCQNDAFLPQSMQPWRTVQIVSSDGRHVRILPRSFLVELRNCCRGKSMAREALGSI